MKLEQAKQKPVAWVEVERGIPMFMDFADDYKPNINNGIAPLYAAPVRTKDLTDDEILQAYINTPYANLIQSVRAVIAADREKNRGTA
jgi:hypothetical protein